MHIPALARPLGSLLVGCYGEPVRVSCLVELDIFDESLEFLSRPRETKRLISALMSWTRFPRHQHRHHMSSHNSLDHKRSFAIMCQF